MLLASRHFAVCGTNTEPFVNKPSEQNSTSVTPTTHNHGKKPVFSSKAASKDDPKPTAQRYTLHVRPRNAINEALTPIPADNPVNTPITK
jgi:hypothetical protein